VSPSPGEEVLELRVGEMRQLFNSLDPAPFRERDLDPKAQEYIVAWARETPGNARLGLVVRLAREAAAREAAVMLEDAVHSYFIQCAAAARQRLRRLFRVGRVSLLIGLAFLAGALLIGEFVKSLVDKDAYGGIIMETFVIGGWVALWRPLEIFLYEWWPIREEAQLYRRLGEMRVTLIGAPDAAAGPAPR
jgi:hypothetical protein